MDNYPCAGGEVSRKDERMYLDANRGAIMATEVRAELSIRSRHLTPEQIGSHVGLEADVTRRKGDQRGSYEGRPVFEKETRWTVRSGLAPTQSLEDHTAELSERLEPVADKIRALAQNNDVSFACVIYADSEDGYNQEIFLPKALVSLISALNASFWADVYFLSDTGGSSQ